MKIDWTKTSLSVEAVTASWSNRSLRPNPEYQRGWQWKRSQQQLLIDSMFRGYPLPRFYFQLKVSQDALGADVNTLDIIDGQQRIIAMTQFRQDQWPLLQPASMPLPPTVRDAPCAWGGLTFSGLSAELQEQFLGLDLSIVLITEAGTPDEVRDLFIRLQAGTPLTPQQVRDAWPGNVSPYVELLAGKLNRNGRFGPLFTAIDRRGTGPREDVDLVDEGMDARQTCAQLLCLYLAVEAGKPYPNLGSRSIDNLYHENTDLDPHGPQAAKFEELLAACQEVIVERRSPQSVRSTGEIRRTARAAVRKNRLFSLFLFLRDLQNGPASLKQALPEVARRFWSDIGDSVEPKVGRVVSPTTIAENVTWFRNEKMGGLTFPELDSLRLFSQAQRADIYARYGGLCAICGQALEAEDAEYDHVVPWISGGRTEVSNGRPVHSRCHTRGTGAVQQR